MTKELANKLKVIVEHKPTWDAFLVMIQAKVDYYRHQNDQASANDVVKNQGAIAALLRLEHLREEIQGALK